MLPATVFTQTAVLRRRPAGNRSLPASAPIDAPPGIELPCAALPYRQRWHTDAEDYASRGVADLAVVLARPAPGIDIDDEAEVSGVRYSIVDKDDYAVGHTRLLLRRVG